VQLGAISTIFINRPLEEAARRLHELGFSYIEIGAGGFFPKNHCYPAELLRDPRCLEQFQATLERNRLTISAFALHGEPLHPDPAIVQAYEQDFRAACELAPKIGVTRFTLLAGLPAGAPGDTAPNWILYPYPPRNLDMLRWQWDERLIPYWREHGRMASDAGVRLCFEMHPVDMVFKPEALLELRDRVGPVAGCNLDPSHLFWQGMDIPEVIRMLGRAIYHTHAKDSCPDDRVTRANGILDAKDFQRTRERSWIFRTVGYGHPEEFWRTYISALRQAGYDDVLSIEHEDPLIDPEEGFELAAALLQRILIRKPPSKLWYE